jgi:hypothetical protein
LLAAGGREIEVASLLGSCVLAVAGAAFGVLVCRGFQPARTGADELSALARDNCTFRRAGIDAASGAGSSRSSELTGAAFGRLSAGGSSSTESTFDIGSTRGRAGWIDAWP